MAVSPELYEMRGKPLVQRRKPMKIAHRRHEPVPRRDTDQTSVSERMPTPRKRQRFRERLLAWYSRHGRDLPWRKTTDPYHILVSEIMLQQTQVDRVQPKYEEWLTKYPSLDALAAAPEEDVTASWYPLGYNIRPRRLHAIAKEAVSRYGGELPSDERTLLSFKGIGPYTAGAIRSFAFGERAAILDTNVARVLFRVFVGTGDPRGHRMKRHLWTLSAALVPRRRIFDFNQALMDLGATVCVARNPKCLRCPMAKELPLGRPRSAMTALIVTAALIERAGRVLVAKRPDGVHLAGHWEFPGGKCDPGESLQNCIARELREELNVDVHVGEEVFTATHEYPERTVELHFLRCELAGEPVPQLGQEIRWVPRQELGGLEFPPADAELIRMLTEVD